MASALRGCVSLPGCSKPLRGSGTPGTPSGRSSHQGGEARLTDLNTARCLHVRLRDAWLHTSATLLTVGRKAAARVFFSLAAPGDIHRPVGIWVRRRVSDSSLVATVVCHEDHL
ncbi:hypothetical protein NDU88_001320 [Pleurodeles waltl]|uniref:Uncharacterized protein n=1 Tax=Pleurodeles waltl TaxID=8319 RepID=A0AAV7W152_PLEWA|nr:hypothetical protein NDU88_001320 [Pleurodeles waltl]